MAGDRSPAHPPPAKHRKKSSTTTIASLGNDVLFEIFVRLPSLATLVRACHACRSWRRAVASSREFRRRFRETHPAPLLGLFFDPPGAVQTPALPVFPSFVPARGADRDQAAAVRGGDFFLTSLQERPGGFHGWDIHDCRGGYILVGNSDQRTMAVLNPMEQRSERFFDFGHGHEDTRHGNHGLPVARDSCHLCRSEPDVTLDARLLCSEEDPKSFRVVIVAYNKSRVRAMVFSSGAGEWSVRPWVDVPSIQPPLPFRLWLLNGNMQANGILYWVNNNLRHMLTLDTATMVFSVAELPEWVNTRECSLVVGETINGTPCVVYAFQFRVCLFLQTIDDDGVKRWLKDKTTYLDTQFDGILGKPMDKFSEVKVVAVRDRFAYLATSVRHRYRYATTPSWVLSLCLETMKLEKMFQRPYECSVHPYVMPWPLSLVGSYGSFALEDGTRNT